MKSQTFISSQEQENYDRFYLPRFVQRRDGSQESLDYMVKKILHECLAIGFYQGVFILTSDKEDGISWTCEQVTRIAKGLKFRVHAIRPSAVDIGIPQIVQVVGEDQFLKLLRDTGVIDARRGGHRLWFVIVASLLLLAASSWVTGLVDSITGFWVTFTAAILNLISVFVRGFLYLPSREELLRQASSALVASPDSVEARRLQDKMVVALRDVMKPACFIVDDLARIDSFSRACVRASIESTSTNVGALAWIVLESKEDSLLSKELAFNRERGLIAIKGSNLEVAHILNFPRKGKIEALKSRGLPESRADEFYRIKRLVGASSNQEFDLLRQQWEDFKQKESIKGEIGSPEILFILGVNSSFNGFALSNQELVSLFSEKNGLFEEVICGPNGLPNMHRQRVEIILTQIRQKMGRWLDESSTARRTILSPLLCRLLLTESQLNVSVDFAHFLWMKYWSDRSEQSSNRIFKVAYHADAILGHDLEKFSRIVPKITAPLTTTLGRLATQGLSQGYFEIATTLSKCAAHLTEISAAKLGQTVDNYTSTMLDAAWTVYSVTLDDELLGLISRVVAVLGEGSGQGAQVSWIDSFLRFENVGALSIKNAGLMHLDAEFDSKVRLLVLGQLGHFAYWSEQLFDKSDTKAAGIPSFEELAEELSSQLDSSSIEAIYQEERARYLIIDYVSLTNAIPILLESKAYERARDVATALALRSFRSFDATKGIIGQSKGAWSSLLILERALRLDAIVTTLNTQVSFLEHSQSRQVWSSEENVEGHLYRINVPIQKEDKQLLEDLNDLLSQVGESDHAISAGERFVPVAVLEVIDRLYTECTLVWDEFGLRALRDRTSMKHAVYLSQFSLVQKSITGASQKILDQAGPMVKAEGLAGFTANSLLAAIFRNNIALYEPFIVELFARALEREDQHLLWLYSGLLHGSSPINLRFHELAVSWMRKLQQKRHLATTVEIYTSTRTLPKLAYLIFQTTLTIESDGSDEEKALLFDFVEDLKGCSGDSEFRDLVETYMEFAQFVHAKKQGKAEITPDFVQHWLSRKTFWLFPTVLAEIVEQPVLPSEILAEAMNILGNLNRQEMYKGTPIIHLFMSMVAFAKRANDGNLKTKLTDLFDSEISKRLDDYDCSLALRCYDSVVPLSSEPDAYRTDISMWTARELQQKKASILAGIVRRGYYFGMFECYVNSFRRLGLKLQVNDQSFVRNIDLDSVRAGREVFSFPPTKAKLEIFKRVADSTYLVADFLLLGKLAFDTSHDDCAYVKHWQTEINSAIALNLKTIFNALLACNNIPEHLSSTVMAHRAAIERIPYQLVD